MSILVNTQLVERLKRVQQYLSGQWQGVPLSSSNKAKPQNANHMAAMRPQPPQQSLKSLAKSDEDDDSGEQGSGGRGTAKGLRGKDDPQRRGIKTMRKR